jgi:hypothetical protein
MAEKKYVKTGVAGRKDGPTLWQIFFEGVDSDEAKERRMNTTPNPLDALVQSSVDEEHEVDANGFALGASGTDVVIFDKGTENGGV